MEKQQTLPPCDCPWLGLAAETPLAPEPPVPSQTERSGFKTPPNPISHLIPSPHHTKQELRLLSIHHTVWAGEDGGGTGIFYTSAAPCHMCP